MITGWLLYQGYWYYFEPRTSSPHYGEMITGWRKITVGTQQHWYYFNSNGKMRTSAWLQYNNQWYYFNADGEMVTGWHTVNGYTYFFDDTGEFVNSTRRALLMGYSFNSSSMDMYNWDYCLSNLLFGGDLFSSIVSSYPTDWAALQSDIGGVMSSANDCDITYLCITCYGTSNGGIVIAPGVTITGQMLKNELNQYKGKVVLFLSFDYSGMIITRNDPEYPEMDFLSAFIEENRSGELLNDKYIVICSSRYNEQNQINPYAPNPTLLTSVANQWWMKGGGWDPDNGYMSSMGADANGNSIVTFNEIVSYSSANISGQHIVAHSYDPNFTVFARTQTKKEEKCYEKEDEIWTADCIIMYLDKLSRVCQRK